jgi:hypothetical protein
MTAILATLHDLVDVAFDNKFKPSNGNSNKSDNNKETKSNGNVGQLDIKLSSEGIHYTAGGTISIRAPPNTQFRLLIKNGSDQYVDESSWITVSRTKIANGESKEELYQFNISISDIHYDLCVEDCIKELKKKNYDISTGSDILDFLTKYTIHAYLRKKHDITRKHPLIGKIISENGQVYLNDFKIFPGKPNRKSIQKKFLRKLIEALKNVEDENARRCVEHLNELLAQTKKSQMDQPIIEIEDPQQTSNSYYNNNNNNKRSKFNSLGYVDKY